MSKINVYTFSVLLLGSCLIAMSYDSVSEAPAAVIRQNDPYSRALIAHILNYNTTPAVLQEIALAENPLVHEVHEGNSPLLKTYGISMPYAALGTEVTPIDSYPALAEALAVPQLFVKNDGVTGEWEGDHYLFGGNKIRKLRFLLGDALARGFKTVMTFGAAGSNHALATAVHAKKRGLDSILMLKPQNNNAIVCRNLLLDLTAATTITWSADNKLRALEATKLFFETKKVTGQYPYVIPTGGSNARGALGFVDAIFELKQQIEAEVMPMPTRIYVPVGSQGTISGLLLGVYLAELPVKVIGVTVEPEEYNREFMDGILLLVKSTNALLREYSQEIPLWDITEADVELWYGACGTDYALYTQEGVDAMKLVYDKAGFKLDGTYSGKGFAGMQEHVKANPTTSNDVVLFWNTFCGLDFPIIKSMDYHNLPKQLHSFFEEPMQVLDLSL